MSSKDDAPVRQSREDWKKSKQLEEDRKAGRAPAELDEEGKEINPHIPQYIAQAPWYLNKDGPSLKHQRPFQEKQVFDSDWYKRGQVVGPAATKFRKGSCANCGAMTHNAKQCTERPRKIGAKYTGRDIKADEIVQDLKLDYDGKRDRWNGYDPSTFDSVIEQFEKTEQERRKKKKEAEMKAFMTEPDPTHNRFPHTDSDPNKKAGKKQEKLVDSDSDSDSDVDQDEDFADTTEQTIGVKKDTRTRSTVRNLRIREDTAKYLRNLDIDSAYYDPKSRSMRENPNPNAKEEQTFYGDNFVRQTGETNKFNEMQQHSWQRERAGASASENIHLQAAPSLAELQYKQYKNKKESTDEKARSSILEKYGGKEHLIDSKDEGHLLNSVGQSEEFVQYTHDGSLQIGNGSKSTKKMNAITRSKYPEDVFPGNHTSVWGSFWENGKWGYSCCQQHIRNSYCSGKVGIQAKNELKNNIYSSDTSFFNKEEKEGEKKEENSKESSKKSVKEERDERKRGYNSLSAVNNEVSKEEIEAYNMKKKRFDDPMKDFVN